MPIRVYIPEAFIALNKEITRHPLLMQRLQKHPYTCGPEIVLAEIASYCSIAVNGIFDENDLKILAEKCLEILQKSKPKAALYLPPEDWSAMYETLLREQHEKKNSK